MICNFTGNNLNMYSNIILNIFVMFQKNIPKISSHCINLKGLFLKYRCEYDN